MTDSTPASRGSESEPNDLIVSLKHYQLVRAELRELNINADCSDPADMSTDLGLARLSLTPDSGIDGGLLAPGSATTLQIDSVVEKLRGLFRAKYQEWVPSFGKNRLVQHVAIVGEVTFGAGGAPKDTGAEPPPWPARGAGPGQGVRIGVADTVLAPQPWMAGGWSARYADQEFAAEPLVTAGHATFVTGLVLSQAPGAVVEVRRALDEDGSAKLWDVAKQIVSFGRAGVDVLNLSFACYTDDGNPPLALSRAIDRLSPDMVVVAAAGNIDEQGNPAGPAWPAAFEQVVAVGAARNDGESVDFSPVQPWVDVRAPGFEVCSTFLDSSVRVDGSTNPEAFHGYATWSGTSFAAALVSGVVAAGVQPGRIGARESLDNILTALHDPRRTSASVARDEHAPFLNVRLLG